MRYLILFIFLFLVSCEKYVTEITTLTLGGKYVLSKMEVTNVDQNSSADSLYLIGSTYKNTNLPHPFDSIRINHFYIHLDNWSISLNLKGVTNSGTDIWEIKNLPYYVFGNNAYNLGYLKFELPTNSNYSSLVFKIEEDGLETLQLRGFESWPFQKFGPKQEITFLFKRVGP